MKRYFLFGFVGGWVWWAYERWKQQRAVHCPYCSEAVPEDANFCEVCGQWMGQSCF